MLLGFWWIVNLFGSMFLTLKKKRFCWNLVYVMGGNFNIFKHKMLCFFFFCGGRWINVFIRSTQKVTFYDDFAVRCDKALDKDCDEPVVIIIGCAKIGHYQGTCFFLFYNVPKLFFSVFNKIWNYVCSRWIDYQQLSRYAVICECEPSYCPHHEDSVTFDLRL